MRGLGVEEAPGIEMHTLCNSSICEMAPMSDRAELQACIEQDMGLKVVGDEAVATLDATSVDSCNTGLIPVPKSVLKRARKQRKSSSTMSLSLEAWVEGLKGKLGHDEVQIQLIEEARQDVILFFEKSLEELGKGKFVRNADELALQAASLLLGKLQGKKEDELVSNASSMKVNKGDEVEFFEKGSEIREKGEKQCEDTADEGDFGINEEFAIDEIESPTDVGSADCGDGSASYEEEHLVEDSFSVYEDEAADGGGEKRDSAAGNDEEWADDEGGYSINGEGVEEEGEVDPSEGRDESGEYDDGDENRLGMEEGSNVDEYDEYEFNSEEWLDWLERGLRPNVAKVKVEVDLLKPLSSRIFIRMGSKKPCREDEGFWQPIEYEKVPPYCLTCRKQGHLAPSCRSGVRRSGPTKKHLAKKRRREKGKDPIIDVGLGNFSVPQVAVGVGTSTNPVLGLSHSQPVAHVPLSTCNAFTLLQDVNETAQAEGANIHEDVHDMTLANQAHTQEATTKDFDADLDDHLAKVLDKEGVPQTQEEPQVEDSSTQGDASSAAPISMGLQTPVREQGTGLCPLNTEQATIPTVSPVAHNTKAPVTKCTRRTRSASEQSNVTGFYREAYDDDDSDSSVAGRVAIFESAGRNREFVGGHASPSKTSKAPFGGRITRSQVRPEQSSAAVGTPISSQSPSF
nr:ABC transporter F family member 4-like [Ipomoea batatas]